MSEVSTGNAIQKASYTHKALIDLIVLNPWISQGELARHFGYTEGWMSQILRSDALRNLLAERRDELMDPVVLRGVEKRLEALAMQSLEVIEEQLQVKRNPDIALKALELSTRALGYGAKQPQVQVNNFVVAMPEKSIDSAAWRHEHAPRTTLPVIDLPTLDTQIG